MKYKYLIFVLLALVVYNIETSGGIWFFLKFREEELEELSNFTPPPKPLAMQIKKRRDNPKLSSKRSVQHWILDDDMGIDTDPSPLWFRYRED
tara:strand:- start:720 stop:998 length:279 start_codon:yes stop_codon:yes gene_type:complete